MQVQVSGKHVDVGEALRARVSDEIAQSIGKYFDRGGAAEVVVSKDGYAFRVDCSVKLASGQQLISHGSGGDAHAAFDAALAKIDTRIRRYKRRLKSHSAAATAKKVENAAMFVLRAPEGDDIDEDWDVEDDHPTGAPAAMVIAETQAAMKTMTVSMAVMELDLTGYPAIVFRNAAHGGISVVYRRPDGNIGWIDPERTKSNGNGSTAS
ncbi:MAG: ribosome-associated translation inhibitor RaiA [Proteobacteria bacterium]|nr:ribosome-associated translation inhibitor RaiA [Pseudomonadota bacterium]